MTTLIRVRPTEKGTAVVTMAFTDSSGASVSPENMQWQLMLEGGTIINNRSFSNGAFTGDYVVLTGNDLAAFGADDDGSRIFSFQGKYDSDVGQGLSITGECAFKIQKLVGQEDQ